MFVGLAKYACIKTTNRSVDKTNFRYADKVIDVVSLVVENQVVQRFLRDNSEKLAWVTRFGPKMVQIGPKWD